MKKKLWNLQTSTTTRVFPWKGAHVVAYRLEISGLIVELHCSYVDVTKKMSRKLNYIVSYEDVTKKESRKLKITLSVTLLENVISYYIARKCDFLNDALNDIGFSSIYT